MLLKLWLEKKGYAKKSDVRIFSLLCVKLYQLFTTYKTKFEILTYYVKNSIVIIN